MKRWYTLLFLDSYSDCDHYPGYFVLILIRISIRVRLKHSKTSQKCQKKSSILVSQKKSGQYQDFWAKTGKSGHF